MRFKKLHSWEVTPSDAVEIQKRLRSQVKIEPFDWSKARTVAGVDISYNRFSPTFYAAFVVLDARSMEIIDNGTAVVDVSFPYIPGLLSFREIPALIQAWEALATDPDVILVDGHGIAHPRRLGIASHLGLVLDKPTIGCGKSILAGTHAPLADVAGAHAPLVHRGERVGEVLRLKRGSNPVIVSPGHRTDLQSALTVVRACARGYKLPEPTRQAHLFVNHLRIEKSA